MFSRTSNLDIQTRSTNQNLKIGELFEYVKSRNQDKIKDYFSNPDYKVWQLKDENGYTILHKSVFNSDLEITELIIKEAKRRLGMGKGDSLAKFINDKTNEGLTALHYSANKGSIPLFKLLIENGANIDAVTNLGKNVMHMAAEGNQPSMIIYLITEQHQSSQSVDENGSTPLHWACYFGAEEAVNFLLNLKANINEQDKEKLTPLHLAVNEGKENIVIKLLQKNADKYLANNKGELPIDLAKKKNYKKIEEILSEDNYNPLFSLQLPKYYIQPKDIYKKFIILMIVIPEIITYIFILPYLKAYTQTFINLPAFILCLLFYFIFIGKDPGYKKNIDMEKEAGNKYPLIIKVNEGIDVRNYCPKCFVQKASNIFHCFECDKCVAEFSHHCFWINKCIAKGNLILYFFFIFFSLFYANHTLYISLELLWDDVNLPYDTKLLHIYLFNQQRGFRVLGASAVGVFSLLVGVPLWFLFLIEIFKKLGCLGKKKITIESQLQDLIINSNNKKPEKLMAESTMVELKEEKEEYLLEDEDEKEGLLDNNNNNDDNLNDNNNIINDVKVSFGANPLEDMDDKINIIDNNNNQNNNNNDNIIQLVENGEVKQEEEVKNEEEDNNNQEDNNNINQAEINNDNKEVVNEEQNQGEEEENNNIGY